MPKAFPQHVSDPQSYTQTAAGAVQGVYEDGVNIYRGIPFAAPPVGKRRFCAPAPVEPWTGTRPAHTSGAASAQVNSTNRDRVLAHVRELDPGVPGIFPWPDYAMSTYDQPASGEDCLYLDIWVPADTGAEALPVLLYYHGGANAVSSCSFAPERAANFAREQRVVVVRPNYRMGAAGWVHFGLINDELAEAVNLGFQDQVAALEWVHANIASFGGDPENITVAGESAGATAVSQILTNPRARGFVRRAVMQSLSPFNNWCTQPRLDAEAVAHTYWRLLGAESGSDIRNADIHRLLAVQNIMTRYMHPDANVAWRPLGAVVDHQWVPELPAQYLSTQQGDLADIDVLIGFAKDEWQFFRGHSETVQEGTREGVVAVLRQVFGDRADAVFDRYQSIHPAHGRPGHVLSDVMSFEFFKMSSLEIAQNLARQNSPVWVFQFAWDLPGLAGELRAVHTGDMPFIWSNYTNQDLADWPIFHGIDRARLASASRSFSDLYGRFVRNGDPGPAWKPFGAETHDILWLGETLENRPRSLDSELETFHSSGLPSVAALEGALAANVRAELGK